MSSAGLGYSPCFYSICIDNTQADYSVSLKGTVIVHVLFHCKVCCLELAWCEQKNQGEFWNCGRKSARDAFDVIISQSSILRGYPVLLE